MVEKYLPLPVSVTVSRWQNVGHRVMKGYNSTVFLKMTDFSRSQPVTYTVTVISETVSDGLVVTTGH